MMPSNRRGLGEPRRSRLPTDFSYSQGPFQVTDKPHILVIGIGSIGERHVRCLLGTGRAQVSICEVENQLRGRIANDYRIDRTFASLDEAMDRPWHGAVIATPAHTHIPIAIRLAQSDVSLLIEKPLAVTTDGVEELRSLVAARRLSVTMAYVYRAHPALAAMREAIYSGRFGRPVQLIAVAGQHFPTYRPSYSQTYYANHARGGGAIQDALTHIFNVGEWLVGPITRLTADASHEVLADVSVEDTVNVIARHRSVLASYSLNQYQAPNELTLTVVCQKGTARWELHRHAFRWMTGPDTAWQEQITPLVQRDDWFSIQSIRWLDTLAGRADPLCTLDEGWQTLKVNQAALASEAQGISQEIPVESKV